MSSEEAALSKPFGINMNVMGRHVSAVFSSPVPFQQLAFAFHRKLQMVFVLLLITVQFL